MVKRLPTMWETWVWSLGQQDPLEKEMATHSSTLAGKIPWTEEHGRLQSMGSQRVRHDWTTSLTHSLTHSLTWCWSWNSNPLATWCKELTHWKRPWGYERLKAGGEGDNRGWDGWMASPTQWTWVWGSSGVGDGQGSLVCCSQWCHKESDMTEGLNGTEPMR